MAPGTRLSEPPRRRPDRPLPAGVDLPPLLPGEDLTVLMDAIVLVQARDGYRFGEDAVALARHVLESGPRGPLLEIGTGSGVIPLVLAHRGWEDPIWAVEFQESLADRAARNVRANHRDRQIRVIQGDARDPATWLPAGTTFPRVVSNPPFWPVGSGRRNPHPEKEAARHEVFLDLPSLLRTIRTALAPGGIATVLLPMSRLGEIHREARALDLWLHHWTELLPAARPSRALVAVDLAPGPTPPGGSPHS